MVKELKNLSHTPCVDLSGLLGYEIRLKLCNMVFRVQHRVNHYDQLTFLTQSLWRAEISFTSLTHHTILDYHI